VIGVQAAVCPSARASLQKGEPTRVTAGTSIADGINVKKTGDMTFRMIQSLVDEIVLVEEEQIAGAMLLLLERKKILAEGSGAATLAALISGAVAVSPGERVVLTVSGGNVDSPLMGRIISKGLIKHGRVARIRVRLDDTPGSLAGLLGHVARLKANILHIYHDRNVRDIPMYVTHVELEIETRGPDHVRDVLEDLKHAGYEVTLQ
jgi:threonine dehydratase